MNREEYRKFHAETCERMKTTVAAKQADYCGSSDSPFANFEKVETMGLCSTEIGMMTRMLDKFSRITSFLQQGTLQVEDEKVTDSCEDLANYAILLAARIKSRKEEAKPESDALMEAIARFEADSKSREL